MAELEKIKEPFGVLDKWLHYDKDYSYRQVYFALDFDSRLYRYALEKPWEYFTVIHMEKISSLTGKSISEVFWGCYKRPYKYIYEDNSQLRVMAALERAGIK